MRYSDTTIRNLNYAYTGALIGLGGIIAMVEGAVNKKPAVTAAGVAGVVGGALLMGVRTR